MTFREKLVIAILLLVARIVAAGMEQIEGRVDVAIEIRNLANHISVHAKEPTSG